MLQRKGRVILSDNDATALVPKSSEIQTNNDRVWTLHPCGGSKQPDTALDNPDKWDLPWSSLNQITSESPSNFTCSLIIISVMHIFTTASPCCSCITYPANLTFLNVLHFFKTNWLSSNSNLFLASTSLSSVFSSVSIKFVSIIFSVWISPASFPNPHNCFYFSTFVSVIYFH